MGQRSIGGGVFGFKRLTSVYWNWIKEKRFPILIALWFGTARGQL